MSASNEDWAERQATLQVLATAPGTRPEVLEAEAWNVIGDVLFEPPNPERATLLLPTARSLLQRLVDDPDLREGADPMYLNARMTIAVWGILGKMSRGEPLEDKTRATSIRNLSGLVSEATGGDFAIDTIWPHAAKKMREVVALELLIRGDRRRPSTHHGVPSPPFTHHDYVDRENSTTNFQLYGIAPGRISPILVTSRDNEALARTRGVVNLALGPLLMSAAQSVKSVILESRRQGRIVDGQRWLTNLVAKLLATESDGISPDHSTFLNRAGRDLIRLVNSSGRASYGRPTWPGVPPPEVDREPTTYTTSSAEYDQD